MENYEFEKLLPEKTGRGLNIASLILSIVAAIICCTGVFSIIIAVAALICGIFGVRTASRSMSPKISGILGIIFSFLAIIIGSMFAIYIHKSEKNFSLIIEEYFEKKQSEVENQDSSLTFETDQYDTIKKNLDKETLDKLENTMDTIYGNDPGDAPL